MIKTTLGNLLVEQALPPAMRGRQRVLDKKGLATLFQELAENHPDEYRDVSKRLSDIGRSVATSRGSFSFGLKHLSTAKAARKSLDSLQREIDDTLNDETLNEDERQQRVIDKVLARQKPLEDEVFEESKQERNPLAMQILSGARGNPSNLKSLRGADLLYVDHKDRAIPIPITRSYSQGLDPAQYFAGTFGARKGVLATKTATQDAGFLAKQLNQVSHRLVTVGADDPDDYDHGNRGLPTDVDDPDNEGALLASPVGEYQRNTVLTPKVLQDLRARGLKNILVRSPIVGGPGDGVWSRDVGMRERGFLPRRGDYVGLAAAQALSEKLSQGQLSAKHGGGVAGADKAVSGFKLIDQLIQVPKTFRGGAAHSQVDGRVTGIDPAPQGGTYVTIGDKQHYVAQGFNLAVKPGQEVEAGDILSDGIPNPSEIVRHKGIGEGRRYFTKTLLDAYRGANLGAHRRNVELVARGLINHVRLTDELDDHIPEDVVHYQSLERNWKPREGTFKATTSGALNKYLERPVLHYTVGTKIRPSVAKTLNDYGIKDVDVHDDPPPFEPVMIRGMGSLEHDPDWVTRHIGSNLQKSTLKAVHRGASSDPMGTSYPSALVFNPQGFGREGKTKGWQADPIKPLNSTSSVLDGLID